MEQIVYIEDESRIKEVMACKSALYQETVAQHRMWAEKGRLSPRPYEFSLLNILRLSNQRKAHDHKH